ncbi:hypothetical protein SAMN05192555_105106 [Franzmannia pantelleriensis]|uniref:Uncharacterized protein n=1 Tax=Franzmannia pantelleriensis TaxID=48727 RepID=A0A1G9L001_9GAMM|nr:hypothetical protein [Halomonas pantelleriensis]SDL55308.1 hypothetical protein SAMN05192555_105106 [Halomonas pantelleriensis]
MQCKCGSETKLNEAVRSRLKARLEFQVCKACGRVSNAELFVKEVKVVVDDGVGATARQQFANLDADTAKALFARAGGLQRGFYHQRSVI